MDVRERMREEEKARAFWNGLDDACRWLLGDALVLGTFDWTEWGLNSKPSSTFLNALDHERMLWEQEQG